jgi:hypothetical protein
MIVVHFSRPSNQAVKESAEVLLDVTNLYLIDGLQRYFAVTELQDERYNKWLALTVTSDTLEDIQLTSWKSVVINNTTTPMTFVDKCNLIVKYASRNA